MPPELRAATARRRLRVAAMVVLVVGLAACSGSSSPVGQATSSSAGSSTSTSDGTTTSTTGAGRQTSRVSIWGDSLSLQAHEELREQGRAHGLKVAVMAFFGLAPCDVAADLLRDLEKPPDALVIAFSGNNLTPCMQGRGKPLSGSEYYEAYRRDVDDLVAAAVARMVPVLVVGAPAFPTSHNIPDRVELNSVLREVAAAHSGVRYVDSGAFVSPDGFTRTLPCLPGETAALGCDDGRITVRADNGVHFDEPRTVPCPSGHDVCRYTAGGRRFAKAILAGLAEVKGLSYVSAPPTVGAPVVETSDG